MDIKRLNKLELEVQDLKESLVEYVTIKGSTWCAKACKGIKGTSKSAFTDLKNGQEKNSKWKYEKLVKVYYRLDAEQRKCS